MQDYISSKIKVRDVPEQALPLLVSKKYYECKERISRPMLSKLAQNRMRIHEP